MAGLWDTGQKEIQSGRTLGVRFFRPEPRSPVTRAPPLNQSLSLSTTRSTSLPLPSTTGTRW